MEKMKKIIPVVVALVAVGGGAFFGGMKYVQSKNKIGFAGQGNFPNLSAEQRQQRMQQFGAGGGTGRRMANGQGGGANFISGEILSKDDKSVTVKLLDGGSKILFLSASTTVMKTAPGSITDLQIGQTISATGSSNPDGSLTAQTLQLRPPMTSPVAPPQAN